MERGTRTHTYTEKTINNTEISKETITLHAYTHTQNLIYTNQENHTFIRQTKTRTHSKLKTNTHTQTDTQTDTNTHINIHTQIKHTNICIHKNINTQTNTQ